MSQLIKTGKTVFTTQEIARHLGHTEGRATERVLWRAKKAGNLLNPRNGIWTLPVYDHKELACKLYPGSYISLETVLYDAGVIFQRYGASTRVVRTNTRETVFEEHHYIARKIKDSLLQNSEGIREYDTYRIATPERALCDMIYLRPHAQLDNPQYFQTAQSKTRLEEYLLPLYPKSTQQYVRQLLAREI